MQSASKVGLLVVVFGALLFGAYTFLGRSVFAPKTTRFYAEMPDAAGVIPGANVLMAGVKVGVVKSIDLKSPTLARVTMDLDENIKVPEGSSVLLASSFISLGEVPLSIVPGKGGPMAAGGTLMGSKGSPLDNIMPEAKTTLKELEKTLVATRAVMADTQKLLNNQKLIGGVEQLIANSDKTVTQFGNLAGRMDSLIAQNQGKLGQALNNATQAMSDIRQSTMIVTKLLKDGKMTDKAMSLLDNLNATTSKASDLVASLDKFVNDPKLRDPLEKTVHNVEAITDSGTRIAADTEKIAKNGIEISKNVAELTGKANTLADDAHGVLEQLKKILGKTPSTGKLNFAANLDLIRESKPDHTRTDLEASFNVAGNRIHAGLYDAFESNKVTVQLGQPIGTKGEFRYGIYASKPGIGVEYEIVRGLALRGDLFDINSPRADLRARFELGGGFYGWIGAQQLFKRNGLMLGIGFRK